MTGHALEVDPDCALSVEDLEKAIYACMAQADLALEVMNAQMTMEQLIAAKEAEAKAKAELAANKAAKAKAEYVWWRRLPRRSEVCGGTRQWREAFVRRRVGPVVDARTKEETRAVGHTRWVGSCVGVFSPGDLCSSS